MSHSHYDLPRASVRFSAVGRKHVVEDQDVASLPGKPYHFLLVDSANVSKRCFVDLRPVTKKRIARLVTSCPRLQRTTNVRIETRDVKQVCLVEPDHLTSHGM